MREQDVLASISRYIHNQYDHVPINSSRRLEAVEANEKSRKRDTEYFGVGLIRRRNKQIALQLFYDYDRWVVVYLGKDEESTRKTISSLATKIRQSKKILGYFHNYEYESPLIFPVEIQEGETTESHIFAFTGVRIIDNIEYETRKSEDVDVTVPENYFERDDPIQYIQFPKVPAQKTIFDKYKVYLKRGNENIYDFVAEFEHLEQARNLKVAISSIDVQSEQYEEEEESLIPYRYIQVKDIYTEISENPRQDGFWKGAMLFDIESPLVLADENAPIIRRVVITYKPPLSSDSRPVYIRVPIP